MANTGVSSKFTITAEKLQKASYNTISRYRSNRNEISPPVISAFAGQTSYGITKWINPYPDIAFEKVVAPQFGGSTQANAYSKSITISNQPDYIKDYHFISLMRCIDFYNDDTFQAFIKCETTGVTPSQP